MSRAKISIPGAVGAWRRTVVHQVGGFREDTLAEDQDLTLAVRRAGYSVAYADGAVALTEAPDTLRALARQRFRWSFGTLQCAWKHRATLFRRHYGTLGWIAMPNVWLFQLLLPALSPLADLMFVFSLLSVWATRTSHGGTYALVNLEQVLTYYAVFLLVDWAADLLTRARIGRDGVFDADYVEQYCLTPPARESGRSRTQAPFSVTGSTGMGQGQSSSRSQAWSGA